MKPESVPPDTEIFVGPRGGSYIMRNNKRVYLFVDTKTKEQRRKIRRTYNLPRGCFARYVQSTSNV